jgi:hypothetical protein
MAPSLRMKYEASGGTKRTLCKGSVVLVLLMRLLPYTLRAVARNGNARDAGGTRHRGEATVNWW